METVWSILSLVYLSLKVFRIDIGLYSTATHPSSVGIHCSCGITATVDIGAQEIDEWWEREN